MSLQWKTQATRRPSLPFGPTAPRFVPVPVDDQGIRTDALPAKARLVYVTPSHQFPLGVALSLNWRRALLEWATRCNSVIIEDDYDSEFRYGGRPLTCCKDLIKLAG